MTKQKLTVITKVQSHYSAKISTYKQMSHKHKSPHKIKNHNSKIYPINKKFTIEPKFH